VAPRQRGCLVTPRNTRWQRVRPMKSMKSTGDGVSGSWDENDGPRAKNKNRDETYRRVSDEQLRAAIAECRELLGEALAMAGEQTRAELAASFFKTPDGQPGLTGNLAVDMARVQLFFQGKGMRVWEAENTSRTLVELDSIYEDVELLAVKFDRLEKTLPGVDVKSMVAADPNVMVVDLANAVDRMLDLFNLFGAAKARQMLAEAPRLLYCDDLSDKIDETIACIKRVYSRETRESCLFALGEEPNLIFNMPCLPIFADETRNSIDIAELPMQVQESLVYATSQENE
jgi:hypothetical protein